uniref:Uncharacterized protein n=1 Tax=Knipowitschia caucasica TaxID=637954 RepID=A0AAV2M5Q9_KNICA
MCHSTTHTGQKHPPRPPYPRQARTYITSPCECSPDRVPLGPGLCVAHRRPRADGSSTGDQTDCGPAVLQAELAAKRHLLAFLLVGSVGGPRPYVSLYLHLNTSDDEVARAAHNRRRKPQPPPRKGPPRDALPPATSILGPFSRSRGRGREVRPQRRTRFAADYYRPGAWRAPAPPPRGGPDDCAAQRSEHCECFAVAMWTCTELPCCVVCPRPGCTKPRTTEAEQGAPPPSTAPPPRPPLSAATPGQTGPYKHIHTLSVPG